MSTPCLLLALAAGTAASAGFEAKDGPVDLPAVAVVEEERGAQREEPSARKAPTRWGAMGYATTGVHLAEFGRMAGDLERPGSLGEGGAPQPVALLFGGGGRLVVGRWLIGGEGSGALLRRSETSRGTAQITGHIVGFDLGWIAHERAGAIVYPFLGSGGAGYGMTVENRSTEALSFGGAELTPGVEQQFEVGFVYAEAGVGAQVMTVERGSAGWTLGVEVGAMISVYDGKWLTIDEDEVVTDSTGKADGAYVKLTMGGGFLTGGRQARASR